MGTKVQKTKDQLPAEFDYGQDIGSGFENQTSEDMSIPFLSIIQTNSAEMTDDDLDVKAGTLINRTTGHTFEPKDGAVFIPAYTDHVFVEWVPFDDGGGLVDTYQLDDPVVVKARAEQPFGKYVINETNELVETFYVYGIVAEGDATIPVVLTFSSSNIKAYKDWMFRARSVVITLPDGRRITKLPLFAHRYRITTTKTTKGKNTWYKYVINYDGADAAAARLAPNSREYQEARNLKEAVQSGAAKADTKTATREGGATTDADPTVGDIDSEDLPF